MLYVVFLSAKVVEKNSRLSIFGRKNSLLFELFTLYNDIFYSYAFEIFHDNIQGVCRLWVFVRMEITV